MSATFDEALARYREHVAACRQCRVTAEAAPYYGDNPAADGCEDGRRLLQALREQHMRLTIKRTP